MANEELPKELEELSERLRKAEQVANESQAEAAVYRELLEDLYKAADQAINDNNVNRLYEITGRLAFFDVPSKNNVKEWGKYFLHAYIRDTGWLEVAKKALEKIRVDAEQFAVEENSPNAELKERIVETAKDGLIPHI
ncbi:MAG TPA: hypothetical protein VGC91_09415 [Pyrinomonadaceae bacterium]